MCQAARSIRFRASSSPHRAVYDRYAVWVGCNRPLTLALTHDNRCVLVSRQDEACTGQQLFSSQTARQMEQPAQAMAHAVPKFAEGCSR